MKDGQLSISVGCAIAWALWTFATATLVIGFIFNSDEVARAAIFLAIAAGTATIRTYLVGHQRMVRGYAKLILDNQEEPTVASLIPVR